jgi:hypothetical protein
MRLHSEKNLRSGISFGGVSSTDSTELQHSEFAAADFHELSNLLPDLVERMCTELEGKLSMEIDPALSELRGNMFVPPPSLEVGRRVSVYHHALEKFLPAEIVGAKHSAELPVGAAGRRMAVPAVTIAWDDADLPDVDTVPCSYLRHEITAAIVECIKQTQPEMERAGSGTRPHQDVNSNRGGAHLW